MPKYHVLRTRVHSLSPVYWNGVSQTSEFVLKTHGVAGNQVWQLFQGENMTMFYLEDDWNRIGNSLLKTVLDDRSYIKRIYPLQHEAGVKLAELSNKFYSANLSAKEPKKLLEMAKEIRDAWLKHDGLNVFPWAFLGDFLSNHLQKKLAETAPGFSVEDFHILAFPAKKSFTLEEELAAAKTALSICESGEKEILEKEPLETVFGKLSKVNQGNILALVERYYWVPFGYEGPTVWGKEHYLKELKQLVSQESSLQEKIKGLENFEATHSKEQKQLIGKLGVSKNFWSLFEDLHALALMTDERKEFTFQAHVAFHKILKELASHLNVTLETVKRLTVEELSSLLLWPERIEEVAKRRTGNTFAVVFEKGAYRIVEGGLAERIEDDFLANQSYETEIKGSIASKGPTAITKGVVRVLLSSNEVGKVNNGEILVATMTTPDFVPAMRKVAAIITDEGGVTCHAAIVSRELGIPCIIGTRVATKVLKDSDVVLVDTEKGIVKKIEG